MQLERDKKKKKRSDESAYGSVFLDEGTENRIGEESLIGRELDDVVFLAAQELPATGHMRTYTEQRNTSEHADVEEAT